MPLAERLRAWRDPAIALLAAVAACGAYGRSGAPLLGDRAYHVYMAQAVLRGDALYGQTTYGYPPYGPLLSALAMRMALPFGVPSYLAPRILGVLVMAALVLLLYGVAKHAAGPRAALIAAVTLSGFGYLAILSVVGMEPVVLVALFMMLAIRAIQQEAWLRAGVAAGVAALTWQPAVVVVIATAAVAQRSIRGAPRRWRPPLLVIGGAALAAIPAAMYVAGSGSIDDFFFQTLTRKWAFEQAEGGTVLFSWLLRAPRQYWRDAAILLAGAIGFLLYLRRRDARGEVPLLAMTVAWAAWFTIDFAAPKDLVPALPLIAYWAAQALQRVGAWAMALFFLLIFADAVSYRPPYTLDQQLRDVRAILAGHEESFIAFDADELYVLTATRAPIRYTRLGPWVDAFADARDAGGTRAIAARVEQLRPALVIIREGREPSRLRQELDPLLQQYDRGVSRLPYAYTVPNALGVVPHPAVEVFKRR